MRRTVTLDADVERLLQRATREKGLSFKEALNEAVRSGLTRRPPARRRRFVQKTYSLGAEHPFRWEKALAAAGAIEDEELIRNLALRK